MKKFKKYVLMIPLLAAMLLNCVCYGQVLFSTSAIDYSDYFKPVEECPHTFDFTDVDTILSHCNVSNRPFYFYYVSMSQSDYNNYLSGGSYSLSFHFYSLASSSAVTDNDYFIRFYSPNMMYSNFRYDSSTSKFYNFDSENTSYCDFLYFKQTGSILDFYAYMDISSYYKNYSDGNYYYFQYTNIPDFPLFYDYEASQSALNVNVTFSPELTGAFNRTVTDRGQKVTLDEFSFTVENNSKFDVQYLMAIYRDGDSFLPFETDPLVAQLDTTFNGKTFSGSAVYVYVKDEWLYLPHGQQGIITGYAPSSWHKVSSGTSDSVSINFNQLKLTQYTNYNICVYAVRNDLNYVTPFTNLNTFQYPSCNDYHIELDNMQKVYTSTFTIINPATFDPNNNENSYAYDEDDRLLFNRANGYIDDNGEIVIDKVDTNQWVHAGTDPNDPWRGWDDDNNAWDVYYKNQNTVSSDIDQLSNNFSSFFKFVNKVFSYFPKNYQNIIMLGLTSIVVLAVIKVVF